MRARGWAKSQEYCREQSWEVQDIYQIIPEQMENCNSDEGDEGERDGVRRS